MVIFLLLYRRLLIILYPADLDVYSRNSSDDRSGRTRRSRRQRVRISHRIRHRTSDRRSGIRWHCERRMFPFWNRSLIRPRAERHPLSPRRRPRRDRNLHRRPRSTESVIRRLIRTDGASVRKRPTTRRRHHNSTYGSRRIRRLHWMVRSRYRTEMLRVMSNNRLQLHLNWIREPSIHLDVTNGRRRGRNSSDKSVPLRR